MKNKLSENNICVALLFSAIGLFVTVLLFFLFFGRGLQILLPLIVLPCLIAGFTVIHIIPFFARRRYLEITADIFLTLIFLFIL